MCYVISVVPDTLWPQGLYLARLLCPWNSPGKNTGLGGHGLLQGIFRTQGLMRVSHTAGGFFTIWATREAPTLAWVTPMPASSLLDKAMHSWGRSALLGKELLSTWDQVHLAASPSSGLISDLLSEKKQVASSPIRQVVRCKNITILCPHFSNEEWNSHVLSLIHLLNKLTMDVWKGLKIKNTFWLPFHTVWTDSCSWH